MRETNIPSTLDEAGDKTVDVAGFPTRKVDRYGDAFADDIGKGDARILRQHIEVKRIQTRNTLDASHLLQQELIVAQRRLDRDDSVVLGVFRHSESNLDNVKNAELLGPAALRGARRVRLTAS